MHLAFHEDGSEIDAEHFICSHESRFRLDKTLSDDNHNVIGTSRHQNI